LSLVKKDAILDGKKTHKKVVLSKLKIIAELREGMHLSDKKRKGGHLHR
jgi:hypothetical protein